MTIQQLLGDLPGFRVPYMKFPFEVIQKTINAYSKTPCYAIRDGANGYKTRLEAVNEVLRLIGVKLNQPNHPTIFQHTYRSKYRPMQYTLYSFSPKRKKQGMKFDPENRDWSNLGNAANEAYAQFFPEPPKPKKPKTKKPKKPKASFPTDPSPQTYTGPEFKFQPGDRVVASDRLWLSGSDFIEAGHRGIVLHERQGPGTDTYNVKWDGTTQGYSVVDGKHMRPEELHNQVEEMLKATCPAPPVSSEPRAKRSIRL